MSTLGEFQVNGTPMSQTESESSDMTQWDHIEQKGIQMFNDEKDDLFIKGTNIPVEWIRVNNQQIWMAFWLSRKLK